MHLYSLREELHAVALFFDFSAAFPSVAQAYLWRVLLTMGIPAQFVLALERPYANNKHTIKISEQFFPGPEIRCGIKQGDPLSMIIFALAIEPLLFQLRSLIGDEGKPLLTTLVL
jgi:Reverse transcriptase (RNA-dependent DNA polymerase).